MAEEKRDKSLQMALEYERQLLSMLPSGKIEQDDLAFALKELCPEKTLEELKTVCEKIGKGIEKGAEEFRYYLEAGPDALIQDRLNDCVEGMTKEQRIGFFLNQYQLLYKDLQNQEMDGAVARYLAGKTTDELKNDIAQLLYGEAYSMAESELGLLLKAFSMEKPEEELPADKERTEKDRLLAAAAGLYAASVNLSENEVLTEYPEIIGESIGAKNVAVQRILEVSGGNGQDEEDLKDWLIMIVIVLLIYILFAFLFMGAIGVTDSLLGILFAGKEGSFLSLIVSLALYFAVPFVSLGATALLTAAMGKAALLFKEKVMPKIHTFFENLRSEAEGRKNREADEFMEDDSEYEYDEEIEEDDFVTV